MSIGIYKIISPTNRVYIGQSINVEKRIYEYRYPCKSKLQVRLSESFLKYGVSSHIFEIIEMCNESALNERERYWQDHYDVIGKNGLNCKLTETKEKRREITDELRDKLRNSLLGTKRPKEVCDKMSKSMKGRKRSEKQIERMNLGLKKYYENPENRKKQGLKVRKKIIAYHLDGRYMKTFESIAEAGRELNMYVSLISSLLANKVKNPKKFLFKYYE